MKCDIYRPKAKANLYIFVKSGTPPGGLLGGMLSQFGELEFVKTRDLVPGQSLVGAKSDDIIRNVLQSGLHVQSVATASQVSEGGVTIGAGILGASVAGPVGAIVGAIIGLAFSQHAKKAPDDL